ncbi:hypothetical protein [Marinobacterium stanieri]|uniref:hypothetical protein n=1 Tax=Marinobacterium stanieri TaxID=49186 RepID=UPI000255A107|nr:hypothetical protein [Marinobacterium stanieri]
MQLTRLTTRYVENEDRFLISADSDVGVVKLWLTQRLLKRLLPHLIEWVGKSSESTVQEPSESPVDNQSLQDNTGTDTKQSASASADNDQQAASQMVAQYRKPTPSVDADKAVMSCLVHTLKFQPRDKIVRILFELPDDEAILLLQEEHARIWLDVLYRHWQQAQWPDIWPDWMKQAQHMRLTAPASLMH